MEKWRFVKGETLYLVSDRARVMSLHGSEPRILKGIESGSKKMYYSFYPIFGEAYSKEIADILHESWPVNDYVEAVFVRTHSTVAIGN